ncbi:MAG: sn-glycerol-3-phosphate ABC transporter ATP-binding protein UgpC [bacterium]
MAGITIKNLYKSFGDVKVLKDINLDIKDKEFVVLVGPSGCGKSTLLRLIAGLEVRTEGDICIGGKIINDLPPKDRGIAMVFQDYALYPHLNVRNNLAFGLKVRRVPKKEIDERINEAANILQLSNLMDRKPKQLSGGQRQRVAIGRAIVRHPEAFLFDEPLSNLDAKLRGEMRIEIARLHTRLANTMVYVTHDQIEAMSLGDKIVVMNNGIIQQVGTPMDVFSYPNNIFVASFIGTPTMNFINGRIDKENYFNAKGFKSSIAFYSKKHAEKEVTLGVRPDRLYTEIKKDRQFLCNAKIEVVEVLGSETVLLCEVKGVRFKVSVETDHKYNPGDTTDIYIGSYIHLFDPVSQNRLS